MNPRRLCCWMLAAGTALAAAGASADESKAPPRKKPAAAAKASSTRITVPKDAVQVDANTWRHTDPEGRSWIYRETPFGIARLEDKSSGMEESRTPGAGERKRADATTAVEDGDMIRFERPGPFGPYKWQKKKTALNEMEQAIWKRESERKAAQQGKAQE